ncbi:DUF724 domain-containing protein 6 isoform X5 [Capsicum annuum]|uniref:DUF724 domain-containing protein 6 isoform X5 n=1 Tax=Capsicum annuum TaxID=4072 RepID=UPI001FB1749C|nr:DUF724 domain-containing protein 6 isoform X5 [Capsicum annuum]
MRGGTRTTRQQQQQHLQQQQQQQHLTKGSTVEVTSDEEGFKGVWFGGTVLRLCKNKVLVEYKSIVANENGSDPLRELVNVSFVRPVPPVELIEGYELEDVVDANYKDGWWTGVVTRVLEDNRYQVTFSNPPDVLEFGVSELRLHKQWVKGNWVLPGKQDLPIPSDCQTNGSNNCTDTSISQKDVPLDGSSIMNETSEEKTQRSVKYIEDLNEPHSTDEISPEETLQNVLPSCDSASPHPAELPKDMSLEACNLSSKLSKKPRTKSPFSHTSPKSEYAEKKISVPVAVDEQPHNRSWQNRTRKRCQELGEEKKGGALEKLRRLKSPTTGLECTKVRSSKTKRTRQINNESLEPIGDQKQIDAAVEGIQEENKQLGDEEGSSQKKRRGRPPRKLLNALEDMQPSGDHSKDEILDPVELAIMVNEDGKEQLEVPAGPSKKRGRTKKMTPTKMSSEKAIQSSSQQHEKHYVKREKRQAKSLNIESQAQGSVDSSAVKTAESNKIATECEEALAEIPFNGFDDQPLAKWFEEIQSPTSVDGLRISPARSPKQSAEMWEKQDMPMQTPVNGTPATQTATQSLPFVKNTLLWSTVEAMDIFKRIPQKPHFNPLLQCKESSREGMAIGHMVTFLSIVERTSRLHFDDPRSSFQEILETLSDLETHGFDVQLVRDRITELLLMKDKREKLEVQVADIDSQIIAHNMDKERIDGEIEEINKQIAELQDKLSLATSRKVVKDREIDGLRSKLMDIQADTKKAHSEFDSLTSKPL